jgi:hypothetical protein
MRRVALFVALMVVWNALDGRAPRSSLITVDNYERVQIGTSRREVENILGPPRFEVEPVGKVPLSWWVDSHCYSCRRDEWWGRGGIIQIRYADGHVLTSNFLEFPCPVRPIRP